MLYNKSPCRQFAHTGLTLAVILFFPVPAASQTYSTFNGWWLDPGSSTNSISINGDPPIPFRTRVYLTTQGTVICGIWNEYFGDDLISSVVYRGYVKDGRATLGKLNKLNSGQAINVEITDSALTMFAGSTRIVIREEATSAYEGRQTYRLLERFSWETETLPPFVGINARACAEK